MNTAWPELYKKSKIIKIRWIAQKLEHFKVWTLSDTEGSNRGGGVKTIDFQDSNLLSTVSWGGGGGGQRFKVIRQEISVIKVMIADCLCK